MEHEGVVSLYVTAPDAATAERLGRVLVEEGLAACANVVPTLVSIYRWEGAVQRDQEALLIAKSRAEAADAATRRLVELHPYELPCIVVLPVIGGHPAYLAWVADATRRRA